MRYKYRAVDAQGQEITGILTTQTEREATRQLQRRGLTVLNLSSLDQTQNATPQKAQKPKRRDLLAVLHELATLLSAGVSLIEAVESLAASSHPLFITQAFSSIAGKLRQGISFSLALKESGLPLPWYLFQLVEAGELTGKVDQALRDGVAQFEYETRVNDEMRSAMIYPTILIVSGIGAVLMIFIIVVPRFAGILNNRGADVPFLARAVLNSGMFLNHHWQMLLIGAGVLAVFLTYLFTQPKMRTKLSDFSLHVPLLGTWIMEAETARWASMLSTLLENRVSLLRALELAGQAIKLPSLNVRLSQVTKAVRSGTSLSQALQDNDALNPTGHNLIRAGERAGELARMLRSLAKLLEESGRTRMKRFLLLIEPLAILLIGGVIGVIITGVILAITSVNEIKF
jgi:general secretion pathway protein F